MRDEIGEESLRAVESGKSAKKSVFRFLRWRDLVVVMAGIGVGLWLNHHFTPYNPTDYQKWQARPQLAAVTNSAGEEKAGQSGLLPCLFIAPGGGAQRFVSGSIGDCLRLVPDGTQIDVFEIPLTGGFLHVKTDLYVSDSMPLAFTRCVVPVDDWARRFHVYVPHTYDLFMYGDRFPYTYLNWTLPDRQEVHYQRVSAGTRYEDAVYEASATDRTFSKSRIAWNGYGWDLNFESGLTVLSPDAYEATRPQQGSVVGIFDQQGRETRLKRGSDGELKKIVAPDGAWIRLSYSRGRLSEAKDSLGETAKYSYDAEERLVGVVYSAGATVRYAYDSANRVVEAETSPGGIFLKNKYGAEGNVEEISVGGEVYRMRWLASNADVLVVGPGGDVRRVHFAKQNEMVTYQVEKVGR
jgi:YD repeat-containing protein